MDMSDFQKEDYTEVRLAQHLTGLRNNQVQVALIVLALHGYNVRLDYVGEPNASAAKEMLDELEGDATPVWSCSTKAGGFWETWQRDAMKYGELGKSWDVYQARHGL
jgi:hypothetical protein